VPARVAIAVVSWNTAELLDRCLASLRPEHDAGRAEVWVVDNASTDGSAALVTERHPWVRLEAAAENLGFGPAVNRVAERTATPLIAAANADVALAPGALAALLEAAQRHPRAGALAPRLIAPDGTTQHSVHPFPTVRTGLLTSSGLAQRGAIARRLPMEGHWDPERARDVDWAHGAFLLVRRPAWAAVGGFDPEQWLYAEDLDLCWRLRRAGWTTRYVPQARVAHAVSAATAGRWDGRERAERTQRSAYAWMLARRGLPAVRATALAHLAGPALRAAVLSGAARVVAGRGAGAHVAAGRGGGARVAAGRFEAGAQLAAERWSARAARQREFVAMHRTGLEPRAALEAHRRRRS